MHQSLGLSCSRENFWKKLSFHSLLIAPRPPPPPRADSFVKLTTYGPCEARRGGLWGAVGAFGLGSPGARDGQRTVCYVGLEIAQKYCLSSGNLEVGETLNSTYS